MLANWKKSYDKPRQYIEKQRHHSANKCPYSQSYAFSFSPVWMWELDHKESWMRNNWCFHTVVLEKTLESPLDSKEIKPVKSKGNQLCMCIGRTDAQAPIICPPDGKCQLTLKYPDVGKDWRQEKKGQQRMISLEGLVNSIHMSLSKLWKMVKDREAWHAAVHVVSNSQTWLSEWTTIPQPSWTICSLSSWVYTSERTLGIDRHVLWK